MDDGEQNSYQLVQPCTNSNDPQARMEGMAVKFQIVEWGYATTSELQRFIHDGRDSIFDEYFEKMHDYVWHHRRDAISDRNSRMLSRASSVTPPAAAVL